MNMKWLNGKWMNEENEWRRWWMNDGEINNSSPPSSIHHLRPFFTFIHSPPSFNSRSVTSYSFSSVIHDVDRPKSSRCASQTTLGHESWVVQNFCAGFEQGHNTNNHPNKSISMLWTYPRSFKLLIFSLLNHDWPDTGPPESRAGGYGILGVLEKKKNIAKLKR